MAIFDAWLRWLRSPKPRTHQSEPAQERPKATTEREWVLLESVASAGLGAMYCNLLRQAGIPVLVREWGAGSGALGGVPVGVRLLVPRELLAAAQETLNFDAQDATQGEVGG